MIVLKKKLLAIIRAIHFLKTICENFHPYFVFLLMTPHVGSNFYTQNDIELTQMLRYS